MNGEKLFNALTDVNDSIVDEARNVKPYKSKYLRKKWTAIIVTSVFVVISVNIVQNLDLYVDGTKNYNEFVGPVLVLDTSDNSEGITAARQMNIEEVSDYSAHINDSYVLTNTTEKDRTINLIYPFTGTDDIYEDIKPEILVNGTKVNTQQADTDYENTYSEWEQKYVSDLKSNAIGEYEYYCVEFDVTIPAGETLSIEASMDKNYSFNDGGTSGYYFCFAGITVSSLEFTDFTARLLNIKDYSITDQNFGFDEEGSADSIILDLKSEYYYLELE